MNLYYFSKDWIDRMEGLFKNPRNTYEVKLWENGKLVYDSHKENNTTKPNNNAPKSIKGDYDLSIHGNTIVLVDNVDGTTVEAKCHPDDDFDIGVGIKEAFKKLNEKREETNKKIEVGDWVEIVDPGLTFSTLDAFFKDNNLMQYAARYRYAVTPNEGIQGRVIAIQEGKCVIEVDNDYELGNENYVGINCNNSIYAIDYDGLKKVAKPNV